MTTKKELKERIKWLKEEQKKEYNPYRGRNIKKLEESQSTNQGSPVVAEP